MACKLCKTCNEVKDLELFPKQTSRPDGRLSQCKSCASIRNAERYALKKESIKASAKQYREKLRLEDEAGFRARIKRYNQQKRKTDLGSLNAFRVLSVCKRLNNAPSWLTDEQKKLIATYYREANRLTKELGVAYHVDHIIPLRSKVVCGLHVPWNLQILTGSDNRKKSNKI